MPQLTMRGIQAKKVCEFSKEMIDELENILQCPRNYFTIECLNVSFIFDGEEVLGYPFVEIAWFDRGQDIQDRVALIVTKFVQGAGYQNVDIIFKVLEKNKYYENGIHF